MWSDSDGINGDFFAPLNFGCGFNADGNGDC